MRFTTLYVFNATLSVNSCRKLQSKLVRWSGKITLSGCVMQRSKLPNLYTLVGIHIICSNHLNVCAFAMINEVVETIALRSLPSKQVLYTTPNSC